jgi:ring-1,2-phenylacetyl-CoA epoxidase subunit PaaD
VVAALPPALPSREQILAILDTVKDPEVPALSVRDLGIVREVDVSETGAVTVTVTPTYSGCPAILVIERDIVSAIEAAGFSPVQVKTTFSPPWTTDWIMPEARARLKAYGIAPPGRAESGGLVQLMRVRPSAQCPFCDSLDTEIRSEFGSTACKSLCWCRACRQPFEEFKAI